MIDIHAHILPGVDDGPSSTAEAIKMAGIAVDAGTTVMVATPHYSPRYPNEPATVRSSLDGLREALAAAKVPLRVLPGAEVDIVTLRALSDDELRATTLGGGGRWILLETPFRGWPLDIAEVVRGLGLRGMGAVIAHPERAEAVQLNPDRLNELVGLGALMQLTAGSLTGEHGARPRRTAEALLRSGHAHLLASDAHSPGWRAPGLTEGLDAAARALRVPVEEVRWMVDEGPRLVIQGKPVKAPRLGVPAAPPIRRRAKA